MMNNLYLKLHPSCIAWLENNENYGIINISSDLIDNGHKIKHELESLNLKPEKIVIEKPFLKLLGDNTHKLAEDIIHVQRNFGVLLYVLDMLYPGVPVEHVSSKVSRVAVYNKDYITKDVQLSEAVVLLKGIKEKHEYTPLALLCLHDTLVLKKYGVK